MSQCDTCIAAFSDLVLGKSEDKTDSESEQYLKDIAVDDMPQTEQKSGNDNAHPPVFVKKAYKHILKVNSEHKFFYGTDDEQAEQQIIKKPEPGKIGMLPHQRKAAEGGNDRNSGGKRQSDTGSDQVLPFVSKVGLDLHSGQLHGKKRNQPVQQVDADQSGDSQPDHMDITDKLHQESHAGNADKRAT